MEIEILGVPFLRKGNKIHIKKINRGKFTRSAKAAGHSVQEHARSILNNPNATPLQKRRANFARNTAKWKHQEGGKLNPSVWDTVDNWANSAETALGFIGIPTTIVAAVAPNPVTATAALATNIGSGLIDIYQGARSAFKGNWGNVAKNTGELGLSLIGGKWMNQARKLSKLDKLKQAQGVPRTYVTSRTPRGRVLTLTKEANDAANKGGNGFGASIAGDLSGISNISNE